MREAPIRLRERRAVHARRRGGHWRLASAGGFVVLAIGAACLAPLAPAAFAPGAERGVSAAVAPTPLANVVAAPAAANAVRTPLAVIAPAVATPTPAPTLVPTPVVVPTLTSNGVSMLTAIAAERTAHWVRNHTETALRSSPNDDAVVFTQLPQWSLLKQTDTRPDWLMVQYSGDGDTRLPGPGWVRASDVGAVDTPTTWLSAARSGALWSTWDASAKHTLDMPRSTLMEVLGSEPDFIRGTRVHVRLPGNGRTVPPSEGWVDGDTVALAAAPSVYDIPRAYPEDLRADVRINVPYRTQLDGSDYAGANCGPTVLGMALESFGVNRPAPDLRGEVLESENFDPSDTDAGSFIWALANVARSDGVQTRGLYDDDGALHHWTVDEIRTSVRNRQPVIVQVVYRGLPGREDSGYYGDHYIIITGLMGDGFLYNDPIGGAEAHEAPGFDRLMTATQLQRAMRASDTEYAFSGFSLSR